MAMCHCIFVEPRTEVSSDKGGGDGLGRVAGARAGGGHCIQATTHTDTPVTALSLLVSVFVSLGSRVSPRARLCSSGALGAAKKAPRKEKKGLCAVHALSFLFYTPTTTAQL